MKTARLTLRPLVLDDAFEGTLRRHVKKWGEYLGLHHYGILREDWTNSRS